VLTKEKIQEIIESQKNLFSGKKRWFKRTTDLEAKLMYGYILVLTGVRRSGKSTLLKQVFDLQEASLYLHFDDPRLNEFDTLDFFKIEELYGLDKLYLFDEIHQIKDWEKYLRHVTERKGRAIVTGSNASLIGNEYGSLLTGRNLPTELFPLSYSEFLACKELDNNEKSLALYIQEGGFPELVQHPNQELLRQYFIDIINRDIINRYSVHNTIELNRLALHLMNNVSRPYSINGIKKFLGSNSVNTLSTYITYLEDVYLFFSVPIYDLSYRKQIINNKKVYSIDTGMVQSLTSKVNQDIGRLLENAVFLYLRRDIKNIYYYKNKYECDFIIKMPNQEFKCYQVCYHLNEENKYRELNGLVEALQFFNLTEGTLITWNQNDHFNLDQKYIQVIPAYRWMSVPFNSN
jgi:uncharacterized protein